MSARALRNLKADRQLRPDGKCRSPYPACEPPWTALSSNTGLSAPAKTGATAWQVEAVAILLMTGSVLGDLPRHYAAPLEREGRLRRLLGARSGYQSSVAAVFKAGEQQSRLMKRLLTALESACTCDKVEEPSPVPVALDATS